MGKVAQEKQRNQIKLTNNLLEVNMLNNLKNILIGVFSAIIIVAIGASAYNAFASADNGTNVVPEIAVNFGQGNGNGNSNSNAVTATEPNR